MNTSEKERWTHSLRQARLGKGWTQKEVADQVGVGQQEIGRWERGEASPHPLYREMLCRLFGKTEEELGVQRTPNKGLVLPRDAYFPFNEAPSAPEDLYGRERERKRFIERTKKRAATSIIGPKRIGKTWLLQYLRLVAPEQLGPHFRIGYLDARLPIDPTVAGFTEEALRQFGLSVPHVSRGLPDLYYGLRDLPPSSVPVLCIDKFEALVSKRTEFTEDFYQGLRAMADASALVLIVITRKPLFEVFADSNQEPSVAGEKTLTSPFSIVFEQITLRPFNHSEAEQFIEKKGKAAGLSKEELYYFWHYGKEDEQHWHPALLQGIGKILLEDRSHYNTKDPRYKVYFEQRFQEIRRGLGRQ